ncbi:hypothetical protein Tco_1092213 [Tanacetum coccineum]|uniref:Uncharacterized protein n=1 Tax=Tanacetum coccineum TaxID=301880 RepID=A0ABQ5I977_9ASTR
MDVCFGGDGLYRRAIMKFTVISNPSPYNIILGHPGLKQLRAIPSTIHEMMKFPTPWGIATLVYQTAMIFVAVRSSLRSLKPKRTIESRAKRSSINLIRTLFHITCFSHNVKTRVIIRVLRIILVVLLEHPSDIYVFTMKMEILLEPTSNKLMVGDSNVHTLEDLTLILGILSRRFFLRLKLPDHRSVLTGSRGSSKDGDEDTSFQQSQVHSHMLILKTQ